MKEAIDDQEEAKEAINDEGEVKGNKVNLVKLLVLVFCDN
jgi:hypothetical protein